jgi:putative glutamine amidotransferase
MVSNSTRPLIAVTGRRLGTTDIWPRTGATVSPRGYQEAIARAGAIPAVVDPSGDPTGLLDRFDALVLTGGADLDPATYGQTPHERTYGVNREADDFEIALVRDAIERQIPTLAICRGLQVLNVALGGTLHQHIPEHPGVEPHGRPGEPHGGRTQEVNIEPGTLLAKVMGTNRPGATCHHHQSVSEVGSDLRVVARADDAIVEGLELVDAGGWLLAVQWHPEDTAGTDPANQNLFDALVELASNSPV